MPEGHSVHRIARQFDLHFVGREVAASSPQGRFAQGAEQLTGHSMVQSTAVGKQTFLEFDHGLWLRVHLGIYGAWDFAGDITADATAEQALGRSMGAPRRARLRMAEQERVVDEIEQFPPEPIGQVRVRLLTEATVADLRGPTACEVLTAEQVAHSMGALGPDPLVDDPKTGEERFVTAVRRRQTPIGLLLMDQSVVSGIGNVYRAELLFRAKLNPHTPGKLLAPEIVRQLWRDWTHLLTVGVQTGLMLTMEGLSEAAQRQAVASREDRHWVYHREGLPCRVCGTNIVMELAAARKLYWCPRCQA
ncbi:formamidopyrimidine-DNA glycosylase [Parafrigoribacterium mesophilum]|uniref:Fpg/Nei family DNA glycosylase n=1 Tax=Parafrigoribacterium mesophilum TaxID=433646 RepID=UPI0031FD9410